MKDLLFIDINHIRISLHPDPTVASTCIINSLVESIPNLLEHLRKCLLSFLLLEVSNYGAPVLKVHRYS